MIYVLPAGAGTIDITLTNYIRGFALPQNAGDILFPRVPVGSQTGSYLNDDSDAALDVQAQLVRAPGAPAAEVVLSTPDKRTYTCISRALKTPIPDEDQKAFKWGDLSKKAASYNQQRLMVDREIRIAALVQNAAIYGANTEALAGNDQLDSGAAATDPVNLVEGARKIVSLYADPNLLFISYDVFSALRIHPALLKRFQGVVPVGGLNEAQMAAMFDVERVVVAKSVKRVNGARTRIWTNTMWLGYVNTGSQPFGYVDPQTGLSSLGPLDSSFGKTFVWTDAPGTIDGYGVLTYRHPLADAKTNIVSNDMYTDERITAPEAAFLFTHCLAALN